MREAIAKAREGIEKGQTPFGACLVQGGRIVALAHNSVWQTTDITAHAEINAIREACRRLGSVTLDGCVMYSTCEPCPMCFSACHWARIDTVVFGAGIEDARKAGFHELIISSEEMKRAGGSPLTVIGQVLRAENAALFAQWARRADRRVY